MALVLAEVTLILVGVRMTVSVRGLRVRTQDEHRLSVTDHLTSLGNRRHLFDVLDSYFAQGPRPREVAGLSCSSTSTASSRSTTRSATRPAIRS